MSCSQCKFIALSIGVIGAAALTLGLSSAPSQTAPGSKPATPPASKPATAPAPKPATTPVTPAGKPATVHCTIDDTHSMAMFRVHHLGAGQFWGRFNDVSGTFAFNPASADEMSFDVTIKIDSVDTSVADLDKHLKSADFFAAKDFPEMKFVSTSARKTGENTFDVTGNLTIRGVTKPITAKLEYNGMADMGMGGPRAGFEATFSIKRSEFGVKYGVDKGAVGDDVRVVVCLEGTVQGAKK